MRLHPFSWRIFSSASSRISGKMLLARHAILHASCISSPRDEWSLGTRRCRASLSFHPAGGCAFSPPGSNPSPPFSYVAGISSSTQLPPHPLLPFYRWLPTSVPPWPLCQPLPPEYRILRPAYLPQTCSEKRFVDKIAVTIKTVKPFPVKRPDALLPPRCKYASPVV